MKKVMKLKDIYSFNNEIDQKLLDYISISKTAYETTIQDREWITNDKYDTTYHIEYLDPEKSILKIDFQGSKTQKDWEINFKFFIKKIKNRLPVKPYKFSKRWFAHGGFIEGYKSVNDIFLKEVFSNSNIKTIIIRGYSQGAAYATLCTEDLLYNTKNIKRNIKFYSIVYGSPRVIFAPFSRSVSKRLKNIIRVSTYGDPVTRVPPILFLFKHVGKSVRLNRNPFKLKNIISILFPFNPKRHLSDVYKEELNKTIGF